MASMAISSSFPQSIHDSVLQRGGGGRTWHRLSAREGQFIFIGWVQVQAPPSIDTTYTCHCSHEFRQPFMGGGPGTGSPPGRGSRAAQAKQLQPETYYVQILKLSQLRLKEQLPGEHVLALAETAAAALDGLQSDRKQLQCSLHGQSQQITSHFFGGRESSLLLPKSHARW